MGISAGVQIGQSCISEYGCAHIHQRIRLRFKHKSCKTIGNSDNRIAAGPNYSNNVYINC